ncbi:hypothetical protein [Kribbella sp. NPDC048915]|uniref:hypothetical protein n=1 Tax=Kribbella sp. NPDC048915 TaxID=3155148 RepID=UPI0033FE20E1
MVVLGVVLIVLAVLFGLGVSVSSGSSTTMEVFGVDFGVSVATVFFLGALAGAALIAGLWLMKKGLGRGWRRRKEMRELRARAASGGAATSGDTVGGEITEGDSSAERRPSLESAPDVPADDRLATEQELAPDPRDSKQPH